MKSVCRLKHASFFFRLVCIYSSVFLCVFIFSFTINVILIVHCPVVDISIIYSRATQRKVLIRSIYARPQNFYLVSTRWHQNRHLQQSVLFQSESSTSTFSLGHLLGMLTTFPKDLAKEVVMFALRTVFSEILNLLRKCFLSDLQLPSERQTYH